MQTQIDSMVGIHKNSWLVLTILFSIKCEAKSLVEEVDNLRREKNIWITEGKGKVSRAKE